VSKRRNPGPKAQQCKAGGWCLLSHLLQEVWCSRCKAAAYCSQQCLRADEDDHQQMCLKLCAVDQVRVSTTCALVGC